MRSAVAATLLPFVTAGLPCQDRAEAAKRIDGAAVQRRAPRERAPRERAPRERAPRERAPQECSPQERSPQELQKAARAAIAKWVAERDRDDLVKPTVDAIVAAGAKGINLLAKARDTAGDDVTAVSALRSLIGHVGHRWLHVVEESKMIYAGQYDVLHALMPDVGDFYFGLLLRTPEWFPITERGKVIPALRDLYPKGPDKVTRGLVELMAGDGAEPEHLRVGLAYALAQWGNRRFVKAKMRELEKKSRSADEETAILALRDLAAIQYGIRDYGVAAVTNREFIAKAEGADYYLVPVHYYNTACCLSLSGDRRSALQYLRRCLALNASAKIDSSMRLKRELFESDPEIASVRGTEEFTAMITEAFGPREESKGDPAKQAKKPARKH